MHHANLKAPAPLVVIIHVLEHFVEPLSKKCPEIVHWAKVVDLVGCMHRPVVIRFHGLNTIDLMAINSEFVAKQKHAPF